MKFTIVLPSHESADLSLAAVFIPCLVWMEGSRELLNPHPQVPTYQRGDLQRVLAMAAVSERLDREHKKAVLVCHPTGHGTEACLTGLMGDLEELGFDVVVVRQGRVRN